MAVPEVNKKLLLELESMGFPLARATRALYYSGNASLLDALNWVFEHENDADIDQMPLVPVEIPIESPEQSDITEKMRIKAQEVSDRVRRKKEEEEKKLEREREKSRIRAGKDLLKAKRILEETERKRNVDLRRSEKEEQKRAREKILQKVEHDKVERRSKLGVPLENPPAVRNVVVQKECMLPLKSSFKPQHMRDCLRSLKRNHMDDDGRVKRAFQTLLIYVGNIIKNPDEEKYRRIRVSNPIFQDRVGSVKGGMEFLELCGFERIEGGAFLYLSKDKLDTMVLNSAGYELNYALTNPFFGML